MAEITSESLFDDPMVVVAGIHSRWAHRRKVDLAELVNEPWILSPPGGWTYQLVADALKVRGLGPPRASLVTHSVDIRAKLLASNRFISVIPTSALQDGGEGSRLKKLPINLPARPMPITIFKLRNRTLSPVVDRFIECAREVTKLIATGK